MAIKLKKDDININDELNRELSVLGFQIVLPDDDKEEKKKEDKKDDKNKEKKTNSK